MRWLRLGLVALACLSAGAAGGSEPRPGRFTNPVIRGFAPDPSIARVGADFYLVTSTFEYFPGVPVYHSRDLVNWELIGHALEDRAQVDLDRVGSGSGVHAPTIRHHDGTFYLITTNNLDGKLVNFIVTASDPRGPWSAPHVLEDAPGIDPSLFFDDDGSVWYTGNRAPPDPAFDGEMEIWLQRLDLERMALTGTRHYLWRGCCGGAWAEGPHLYKRNGFYYLLISEGGTAFEHALSVAIANEVTGPYRNNPRNPVLSHRQLSYDHPITGVGHADLVELADGRWYAVALGWRLIDGRHGLLGRETFLLPVSWETEPYWWKPERLSFPVFSPLTGKVELQYPTPFSGTVQRPPRPLVVTFDNPRLGLEWNARRTHARPFYDLTSRPGALRLRLQPGRIAEHERYSFVGVRQRAFQFEAETEMEFAPAAAGEEAGMMVIQNDRSAYLMTLAGGAGGNRIRLYQTLHGEITPLAEHPFSGRSIRLKVSGDYLDYGFHYAADGGDWTVLGDRVDGVALSPAVIRGYNYTGVYIGLYASSNGAPTTGHADFERFEYRPTVRASDDWYRRQRQRQTRERTKPVP